MHELTLFYKPTCPYCQKVLHFMGENDISLTMKNIAESPEVRQELQKIGGKTQIPCLIIDGKPLYESNDIIDWLSENWSKQ
jgi:glutaredoxin 3